MDINRPKPSHPVTTSPHSASVDATEEVSSVYKHISKCDHINSSCAQYCFAVANQTLSGCCSKASKLAVLLAVSSDML